jgi:hypothetical protein
MPRQLTTDPHFTPCPAHAGDELFPNGIFEFNITAMLAFLQEHPDAVPLVDVSVAEHSSHDFQLDPAEYDSFDVSRPVILAEIAPGRYNLIDGNHRMEKARRLGMDTVRAYKFPPEVHMRFLTSAKGYHAYIEYWNLK